MTLNTSRSELESRTNAVSFPYRPERPLLFIIPDEWKYAKRNEFDHPAARQVNAQRRRGHIARIACSNLNGYPECDRCLISPVLSAGVGLPHLLGNAYQLDRQIADLSQVLRASAARPGAKQHNPPTKPTSTKLPRNTIGRPCKKGSPKLRLKTRREKKHPGPIEPFVSGYDNGSGSGMPGNPIKA